MESLPKAIFVSGTDTSVGKTVVTALLSLCLKKSGLKVGVLKPFQTGTESEPVLDIEFVYRTLGEDFNLDEVCPCRLKKPLSPDAAARLEGIDIPLVTVLDHCSEFIDRHDITVVEGAGGLYVPVKEKYLMTDFAADLGLPVLIVTRPGLGTINHTMLSVEYLKQKQLRFMGLVVNGFRNPPELSYRSNLETLNEIFNLKILGIVPDFESESEIVDINEDIKMECVNYFSSVFAGKFDYEKFVNNL